MTRIPQNPQVHHHQDRFLLSREKRKERQKREGEGGGQRKNEISGTRKTKGAQQQRWARWVSDVNVVWIVDRNEEDLTLDQFFGAIDVYF